MAKRILIAMDESKNAMKAVEYVADTVGKTKGVKTTLFSIIPKFPPTFLETDETIHPIFKGKVGVGIARDILKEAKEGQYDTIAIGRRGISATRAFLFGSVSSKVVQFAKNCTVWVVE